MQSDGDSAEGTTQAQSGPSRWRRTTAGWAKGVWHIVGTSLAQDASTSAPPNYVVRITSRMP